MTDATDSAVELTKALLDDMEWNASVVERLDRIEGHIIRRRGGVRWGLVFFVLWLVTAGACAALWYGVIPGQIGGP